VLLARQGGVGPFHAGLRAVTWPLVLAAVALTAMTTVCSAWRWRVVAQALGVKLALPAAVGAYYRSQFLNSVLPGAVLGDVHRAVAHGRHAGDPARGLRAVGYERLFGQVVQALVTAVVLLILPSPVRPALPYLIVGGVWPQLTLASVLIVAGHTTTFVLAARAAGSTAPLGELVALLMLVQTAMVIPFSVGGWGPREGAAAWAFAAAGLGAGAGVPITTLYAVIALVAVIPGGGQLLRDVIHRTRGRRRAVAGKATPAEVPRPAWEQLEAIRG
jgi:Lysylphosphatidylglycerol synthase TM region